jgi:uncharacterized protein YukE
MVQKSTTSPGMRDTGAEMVRAYTDIDKEATTLNIFIQDLPWTGTAAPVFKNALQEWNKQFYVVASHLDTMANFLSLGASDIDDAEYNNAATGDFNENYGVNAVPYK